MPPTTILPEDDTLNAPSAPETSRSLVHSAYSSGLGTAPQSDEREIRSLSPANERSGLVFRESPAYRPKFFWQERQNDCDNEDLIHEISPVFMFAEIAHMVVFSFFGARKLFRYSR